MGRKPCIALLLCLCSCSLDTTPDIEPTSEPDASLARMSPRKWKEASLRFDAPLQPRIESAVKRATQDDADAGSGPKHDPKPESRDAGRTASDRPAQTSSRDAGPMDAGAKQKSKSTSEATGDVKVDPADSGATSEQATPPQHDAGSSGSTRSSEDRSESDHRRHDGEERDSRRERSDYDERGNNDRDWHSDGDRGSDEGDDHRHGR